MFINELLPVCSVWCLIHRESCVLRCLMACFPCFVLSATGRRPVKPRRRHARLAQVASVGLSVCVNECTLTAAFLEHREKLVGTETTITFRMSELNSGLVSQTFLRQALWLLCVVLEQAVSQKEQSSSSLFFCRSKNSKNKNMHVDSQEDSPVELVDFPVVQVDFPVVPVDFLVVPVDFLVALVDFLVALVGSLAVLVAQEALTCQRSSVTLKSWKHSR